MQRNTPGLEKSYQSSVTVQSALPSVFAALTKEIDRWWGEVDSASASVGDIFKVSWGEPWYQFKVMLLKPNSEIIWECIDANQIISGLEGVEKEWVGTQVQWQMVDLPSGGVKVDMEHCGLIPTFTCFDVCMAGWDYYISGSLKQYLETGKGLM